MRRVRALYGAGPLNLLVLLLSFVIAGAAVVGWFQRPRDVETIIEWFVAAIVLHDLVVLPLYSLLDRIAFGWIGGALRGRTVVGVVGSTPYLRIPTLLSGLLLVVFFPVIFGLGRQSELSASGIAESGYLARWLIASGAMFAVSGVAWGVAVVRARRAAGARPVPPAVAESAGVAEPVPPAVAVPPGVAEPVPPAGDAAPAAPADATLGDDNPVAPPLAPDDAQPPAAPDEP